MKKSAIASTVALILAAVLVITIGVGSSWFTNWNIKTWFNGWGRQTAQPNMPSSDETNVPRIVDSNGVVLTLDQADSPIRLSAARTVSDDVSAQADTSYTVTAMVEPSDATNTAVTFTAEWQDSSATWVNGKTVSDYVTLTANGAQATLTCNQAFGEKIVVKCVSVDDPTVYATCTLDYVRRLQYAEPRIKSTNGHTSPIIVAGSSATYSAMFETLTGTVTGQFKCSRLTIALSDAMQNYIKGQVNGYGGSYYIATVRADFSGNESVTVTVDESSFYSSVGAPSSTLKKQFQNALVSGIKAGYGAEITATYIYSYGAIEIASGTAKSNASFDATSFSTRVTGVTLDTPNIIF